MIPSQMPSPLSWGIGRAATLLKILLQYYGKSLEALPGVAYPGFRDNRSTLNTKTGFLKKYIAKLSNRAAKSQYNTQEAQLSQRLCQMLEIIV